MTGDGMEETFKKEKKMEFQNVIENRRSMRKYKEGMKIDKQVIDELIKAA